MAARSSFEDQGTPGTNGAFHDRGVASASEVRSCPENITPMKMARPNPWCLVASLYLKNPSCPTSNGKVRKAAHYVHAGEYIHGKGFDTRAWGEDHYHYSDSTYQITSLRRSNSGLFINHPLSLPTAQINNLADERWTSVYILAVANIQRACGVSVLVCNSH